MKIQTAPTTQKNRLVTIFLTVIAILTVPLVAMQFTTEVNWTRLDFIVVGTLLFSAGLTLELILRRVKMVKQRIILCGAVLITLFIIWAELAVGIFGSPIAGS